MLSFSINHSKNFFKYCVPLACGFLLTTRRKTISSAAQSLNRSSSSLYRILKKQKQCVSYASEQFFKYIQSFSHQGYLIIDDSVISKQFSKVIGGTSEVFDTINSRSCTGLLLVTLVWTDGKRTIPLTYFFWYNKDVVKDRYRTKIDLAQELIEQLPSWLMYKGIIFDGLYASQDMLSFLITKGIRFVARAATNRVITSNGIRLPLKKHPSLHFRKNEHSRASEAEWNGLKLYFTAEKRKDKQGNTSIVFLVSNFEAPSKDYVHIYKFRWGIEMFYRTAKQSLGLKDCQSTALDMQRARVYTVFYMYAFLEHQKELHKASSVESIIHSLQILKPEDIMLALHAFSQIFQQND